MSIWLCGWCFRFVNSGVFLCALRGWSSWRILGMFNHVSQQTKAQAVFHCISLLQTLLNMLSSFLARKINMLISLSTVCGTYSSWALESWPNWPRVSCIHCISNQFDPLCIILYWWCRKACQKVCQWHVHRKAVGRRALCFSKSSCQPSDWTESAEATSKVNNWRTIRLERMKHHKRWNRLCRIWGIWCKVWLFWYAPTWTLKHLVAINRIAQNCYSDKKQIQGAVTQRYIIISLKFSFYRFYSIWLLDIC